MARERSAERAAGLVDEIIGDLTSTVSEDDRVDGWNHDARARWLGHFVELHGRLRRGEDTSRDAHHLMRWLNFDGIGVGPLAAKIRALQDELLRLSR